jgi:transcriptional regulator with GAF, ATPase, and Fis domain
LRDVLNRQPIAPGALDVAALAARADALAVRGRHAAAERALRELAGALARRRAAGDAAAVLVRLGRLLSERGRAPAAVRALEAANAMADDASDREAAAESRVWLATVKTDLGQLAEAEGLCRAACRAFPSADARTLWASAVLARVSLWQGRSDEARALVDAMPGRRVTDERSAFVEATAVRVLLADADVFAAGRRLRETAVEASASIGVVAPVMMAVARLRFHCAIGDLTGAEREYSAVRGLARAARAPLREVRAGLLWAEALRRAGMPVQADRELARLRRLGRAVPALLRHQLDEAPRTTRAVPAASVEPGCVGRLAALVDTCRDSVEDQALTTAVGQVLGALAARRVELWTADRRALATAGEGAAVAAALGALQAGATVGPLEVSGGQEMAVPIRWDGSVVATLAARWDRAPAEAAAWLTAAAAILASRVQAHVRQREDEARCATLTPGLLGRSAAMAVVRHAVARAGPAPFAVLIQGESGVGKELVARAVHAMSARHTQRMCDVNCAALPDDLLESELFGYVRGAFTGALGDRAGLFEDAHGGTLFLDEVVDLSTRAQAKLLRVLQQQEVRRLGESRTRRIDVRIVSAANRDPREAVTAGTFRPDLVYRLDVIRIWVPPLRERREDVADLAHHFWLAAAERVGSRAALGREAVDALTRYAWPGNVRELQNVMAALAVSAPRDGRIGTRHLPPEVVATGPRQAPALRLDDLRRECERRAVLAALARAAGHRGRAARELGLSRQGLLKLMARVGVPVRRRGS